jgi:hypothetical protein
MPDYRSAIARIESGGNYGAVGKVTKGDRPYGKYQVMGANIPGWTRRALGRELTAAQFLADPAAQDATFDHIFGTYVNQYGPRGAAEAWFGGPGSVGKTGRKDVLGTSVGSYGNQFMQGLGAGARAGPLAAPGTGLPTVQPAQEANPMTSYMRGVMGIAQGGGSDWMSNTSYSADALLGDLLAGHSPLRRLMYQKVMGLFG